MSTLRPLYDRVVIRRKEVEEVSKGGIVVPGGLDDKPDEGTVVSVGPGKVLEDGSIRPTTIKPGDKVIISKGTGMETELDGETLVIVNEEDVVGVLS